MNKKALIAAGIITIIFLSSCNSNTAKKYEFFYYPSRNVYYDVTNGNYVYSLNGGKDWDTLHQPTTKDPATLGTKQIIYSATPDIWTNNAEHLQQYGGHAIEIAAIDSSDAQDLISERKAPRKIKPATAATADKKSEKKPGFFKRLFGKKNN